MGIADKITIKPAAEEDETFIKNLTHQVITPYIEATWDNKEDQLACFRRLDHRRGQRDIVIFEGKRAGFLSVERFDDRIFLDQIYLSPKLQGHGIGNFLILKLIQESDENGIPIELIALQANPAKRLYDRLGFKVYKKDEHRFYMRYQG